ncbi:MAG: metal-dependent hydrolase [Clostridiales bacterium]|nr:metal-dependent hydrolase [Clostridiales bacterium]
MIIDFHTHIFPEKIAERTIENLARRSNITPSFNGQYEGLIEQMKTAGVTLAVSLPVLTKKEQFDSVLTFATNINKTSKEIISFAGIHPLCEDIKGKLQAVKDAGIKGVKIHPDYQDTLIDDEKYIEILTVAKELDLIVVTHAGVDCAYRECTTMCHPKRARKVIDRVGHSKFVLAHMGGSEMVDEFLTHVAGSDVYIDTSYVLKYITKEQFYKILEKHGEDKILFATDAPWSSMASDLEILDSYNLCKSTLDKILYKNAQKLLNL